MSTRDTCVMNRLALDGGFDETEEAGRVRRCSDVPGFNRSLTHLDRVNASKPISVRRILRNRHRITYPTIL